jgi:hypothetical protein
MEKIYLLLLMVTELQFLGSSAWSLVTIPTVHDYIRLGFQGTDSYSGLLVYDAV